MAFSRPSNLIPQLGQTRMGLLITILIAVSGFYFGKQVISYFYYYHELVGHMEAQAVRANKFNDDKIRKNLFATIKEYDIPLSNADDIKINRVNGKIFIEAKYNEVVYVDFGGEHYYELYTFHMNPRVERAY